MRTSEQVNELATALAKAQGEFKPIPKNRTITIPNRGPYAYAELPAILEVVRPTLSKHGLAIIQAIDHAEALVLLTRLTHSSGQWVESVHPLRHYEKPQEFGSALTYARRYALTALLGVAAEDDDDASAAQDAKPAPAPAAPPPAKKAAPAPEVPRVTPAATVQRFEAAVIDCQRTSGKSQKSGKDYTRWVAKLSVSDDRFVTFDHGRGARLDDALNVGLRAIVFAVPAQKAGWWDIEDVQLVEDAVEAVTADDDGRIPF